MKIRYIISAVIALGFCSCNDAVHQYDDVTGSGRIFLNEALGLSKSITFVIPDDGTSMTVTPRISKPLDEDLEVYLFIDEPGLADYNERNATSFQILPQSNYSFPDRTVIRAGKVIADPVVIDLSALTTEQNKAGFTYALPISVRAWDRRIDQLESSATYLLAASPVPYADVPQMTRDCVGRLFLAEDYELSSWTFETLFNPSYLPSSQTNYTTTWLASAIGLNEDNGNKVSNSAFMLRLGDLGGSTWAGFINGQVCRSGKLTSTIGLMSNVWHHIALVCNEGDIRLYINGVEAYNGVARFAKTTFYADQGIMLGGETRLGTSIASTTFYRYSQVRFWSVARSVDQLNNNRYAVSADTPGLLGYWKMNAYTEGKANVSTSNTVTTLTETTTMMEIDTYFFSDETGKQPDGFMDKDPSVVFRFATDRRIEVGYDWDGNKVI